MINNKASATTQNITFRGSTASSHSLTNEYSLTDEFNRPLVSSDGKMYVYGHTGATYIHGEATPLWNVTKVDSNTNKKSKKHSIYDDIKDYIANSHSGTTIVFFTDGTKEVPAHYGNGLKVIAWMPLPEPYKGEQK
jgi:tricorn protease-like protein